MTNAQPSKREQVPPLLDSALQSKLIQQFGSQCLRDEMELLLVIEPLYRHIPGNNIDGKVSTMSATEYHIVLQRVVVLGENNKEVHHD